MAKRTVTISAVGVALIAVLFAATHSAKWTRGSRAAKAAGPASTAHGGLGLHVSGDQIVEAGGSKFVMRGVSHGYAWYRDQNQSFGDVKRLGANTLRVVLTGDVTAREVSDVIARCKQQRMICVLEYHDTTGHGDEGGGASTLDQAADFWAGLRPVLAGQEDYVVVNLANEPFGNTAAGQWTGATTAAIRKVRAAGLKHLIMVDGPNWGQDWSGVMRDNAASVLAADPLHNTAFSVHMYGVYGTPAKVTDYFDAFHRAGLPLVVGEFGWQHSDGPVAADAIIDGAQARGIGYLGWSWSGNGGGVQYLDAATGFNAAKLTDWGRRLFDGADGIRATAKEAAVYAGAAKS